MSNTHQCVGVVLVSHLCLLAMQAPRIPFFVTLLVRSRRRRRILRCVRWRRVLFRMNTIARCRRRWNRIGHWWLRRRADIWRRRCFCGWLGGGWCTWRGRHRKGYFGSACSTRTRFQRYGLLKARCCCSGCWRGLRSSCWRFGGGKPLRVAKLHPAHVDTTKTLARNARRSEIKVFVKIVIEYRIEVDKAAVECGLQRFLDGRRFEPLVKFRRTNRVKYYALKLWEKKTCCK